MLTTANTELPAGVHVLSAESQAALARAKEKGDAIAARHAKPGRLAAAAIKTDGPVTVAANGRDF
jgi:hypothetical protein